MSAKKLSAGLVIVVLTASLAFPVHAQREEGSAWGWLALFWNWIGVTSPIATSKVENELLEAGVAADPFGRSRTVIPVAGETDDADAGVAADPFG